MKLKNVAKFFDKTKAVDAYNSRYSFKCQVEPLDMYRTEGTRIKVRNMSTAPEVTVPARRAIKIDSQAYLVSDSSADHWSGESIRNRYVLQGADYVVEIRTIAQVLEDAPGVQAWASIDFNKYSTDERDSADYHPQYHIFLGEGAATEHAIIHTTERTYLVKNSYKTPSGLYDAICNELDDPVIDAATFKSRTYNPITDSFTDSSSTIRCIRLRWQDRFTYLSQASEKFERGDVQLFVPSSVTPKAADVVDLSDGPWRVVSVVDSGSHNLLHLRRA